MTRLDILNSCLEMANYNLDCYSRVDVVNGRTVLIAKTGFEKERLNAIEEISILYDWIYEVRHSYQQHLGVSPLLLHGERQDTT